MKSIQTVIVSILLLSSCVVSKNKYKDQLAKNLALTADLSSCQDSLNSNKNKLSKSDDALKTNTEHVQKLLADSSKTRSTLERLNKLYSQEAEKNEKLNKDYKELLNASTAEAGKLNSHILKKEKELIELEEKVNKLSSDLHAREERVKELEQIIENKEKATEELRKKVANALLSFKDKGLDVSVKNGKVYVSVSDQLLFKSGSVEIDKKGEEAIKKLASVLKSQDDINVMIEGHTDDVPVNKATHGISDNWDLSVLRATTITRIMVQEGLNPQKVTPSGKGEYLPKDTGKNSEARAKNRRTEIILTPKLDELFKLLENN
jgi:chemotaxis protein MotB